MTGLSTECFFNEFLFTRVLTHDKLEQTNSCERSECHGLPMVLRQAYLQEAISKNNPSNHETWSTRCHVGILVDFTPISHPHTPLVPQAYCEVKSDRPHLFHQWECSKRTWTGRLRLVHQWECSKRTWTGRLRLFHQWECLKCNGHGLSVSCVWSGPEYDVTAALHNSA